MAQLAQITTCETTACAYNKGGCSADAVTIAGDAGGATCGTFVQLDVKGGLPVAEGHVGACQRLECAHNTDLMCTAQGITVGGDTANCLTYEAR